MKQRIREARQNESGFTLVELLIVIVVIGILAGIVVFGVATFRQDSTTSACQATLKTVQQAAAAYYAKSTTGSYPTSAAPLVSGGYLQTTPNITITYSSTTLPTATC
ncbi:MAG: prepilin-type N-terminal cleavage/methylation domain-containing protein [Actinomycetes bacterium]